MNGISWEYLSSAESFNVSKAPKTSVSVVTVPTDLKGNGVANIDGLRGSFQSAQYHYSCTPRDLDPHRRCQRKVVFLRSLQAKRGAL